VKRTIHALNRRARPSAAWPASNTVAAAGDRGRAFAVASFAAAFHGFILQFHFSASNYGFALLLCAFASRFRFALNNIVPENTFPSLFFIAFHVKKMRQIADCPICL